MFNPRATYRIQFSREFTLNDLEKTIPYLARLGISTIYASPILEAVEGSTHGYDGINPARINPEVGTEADFVRVSQKLREKNIYWLQDIVPNHLAYDVNNPWLRDLLQKGKHSAYADFFDSAYSSDFFSGPIMTPFLGGKVDEEINSGRLNLGIEQDEIVVQTAGQAYPVSLETCAKIFALSSDEELQRWSGHFSDKGPDGEANQAFNEVSELMSNESRRSAVAKTLEELNKDSAQLTEILKLQHYELCFWKESAIRMNYRRFFTVNGLICLNMSDDKVFEAYHKYLLELKSKNGIQGFRIDHIDGLYNPTGYLEKLRGVCGDDFYIVVEKILEADEKLPTDWPIQGSTGYKFLSLVNNLFTVSESREKFTEFYRELTGERKFVDHRIAEKKTFILKEHMAGEWENLYRFFLNMELCPQAELPPNDQMKEVIGQFLIHCPVYRLYGNSFPLENEDAGHVREIIYRMEELHPDLSEGILLLEKILLTDPPQNSAALNEKTTAFFMRCMQFSGPLMAKGVEDTLMYSFNRFDGHNEVGDTPAFFGLSVESFHLKMAERQKQWPLAINATATHDTKRGEDVRMRLAVITAIPEHWFEKVREWTQLNASLKAKGAPDGNDEYLIYQTLIGAGSMDMEKNDFPARLADYLVKALREAKRHSNWSSPNTDYENQVVEFANRIIQPDSKFSKSFLPFFEEVAKAGMINSVVQVLLKFTCPGVPDVYRGSEIRNLSLVDPDNRRPVDFKDLDRELSQSPGERDMTYASLFEESKADRVKLLVTNLLFKERRENADLFEEGSYLPLETTGENQGDIIAFARLKEGRGYIVVAPVHAGLRFDRLGSFNQMDTEVIIPDHLPKSGKEIFGGKELSWDQSLRCGDLFEDFPLVLIRV